MTTYSAADYSDEDVSDLEQENDELRKRVAELEAAARTNPQRPPASEQVNAGEADWQAKLAGAANPDEVVSIMNERAATLTTGPTQAEMDAAHAAHAQALSQAASLDEANRLNLEFVQANPWALDE